MDSAPRIVILDDDEQVLRWIKSTLESNGYEVAATTSAEQAFAMVAATRPDLLILDLNMPQTNGFEVLKVERAQFPGLRILVISGHMHGALLEAASLLGATATLPKPLEPDDLLRTVREIVGR